MSQSELLVLLEKGLLPYLERRHRRTKSQKKKDEFAAWIHALRNILCVSGAR